MQKYSGNFPKDEGHDSNCETDFLSLTVMVDISKGPGNMWLRGGINSRDSFRSRRVSFAAPKKFNNNPRDNKVLHGTIIVLWF